MKHFSSNVFCVTSCTPRTPVRCERRVNRRYGHAGAVPPVVDGEQQAGLPQEDPGQQAGRQAPLQLLSQHTETALPGPVWTSLLLLLLQPDRQVSPRNVHGVLCSQAVCFYYFGCIRVEV